MIIPASPASQTPLLVDTGVEGRRPSPLALTVSAQLRRDLLAARVGLTHHGLGAAFHRHLGRPPSAFSPRGAHRPQEHLRDS